MTDILVSRCYMYIQFSRTTNIMERKMVKTSKGTQKKKTKKTEMSTGRHKKKTKAHKKEIRIDLNKLKLTLKLLVEHDKPVFESVPVTENVKLKASRPTNLMTFKRMLPVLTACLMNHRYEAAAKIMEVLCLAVYNFDDIIFKGGLQILENHPSSTEEQIQYFVRQLKTLSFINKREIILEHLIYLLKQGKIQQAQTDIKHLLSRHRCYIRKNQVVDTTLKAYMGLLDYIEWARLVNNFVNKGDENEKCLHQQALDCHAEKATKAFQEVLKVPGQWDIFVLKLVEMLEYDNRIDDALSDLEIYVTNNPTHLHSHIYLYEYLKKHGRDPDKQLECLKNIERISPSDPRVLELVDILESTDNGIEKCIRLLFTYVDQYPNKTSLNAWEKLASLVAGVYKRPTVSRLNLLSRSWESRSSYWPAYHFSSSSLHLEKKSDIKLALNKAKVLALLSTEQTTFFELLDTELRKQNKSHYLKQLQKIISSAKVVKCRVTESSSLKSIFRDLDKNGTDIEIENNSEPENPDKDNANQKISDQEKENPSEDIIDSYTLTSQEIQEYSDQVNKEKVKRKRKKESKIKDPNKSHSLKHQQKITSSAKDDRFFVGDSSSQQSTFQDADKSEETGNSREAENPDKENAIWKISDQEKENPSEDAIDSYTLTSQEIQEYSDQVNKEKVKRKRKKESKIKDPNKSHSLKHQQKITSSAKDDRFFVGDSSSQQSTFQDADKSEETGNSGEAENPDKENAIWKISDQEKENPSEDAIDSYTLTSQEMQEYSDQVNKEKVKRKRKKESKIKDSNKSHSLKQQQKITFSAKDDRFSVGDSSSQQSTFQDVDKSGKTGNSREAENPDKNNANWKISDHEKENPFEDTIDSYNLTSHEIQNNNVQLNKENISEAEDPDNGYVKKKKSKKDKNSPSENIANSCSLTGVAIKEYSDQLNKEKVKRKIKKGKKNGTI
ncbi:uncharacterized protein LOC143225621 isoform X2 [Tachypleus tridentatus]|uniref:uncharacterized protein LOC143225621 isoform X2 n=2 Tax=Tachypleus tridentatus TaxID=6853 RepID=UPI003FD2FD95